MLSKSQKITLYCCAFVSIIAYIGYRFAATVSIAEHISIEQSTLPSTEKPQHTVASTFGVPDDESAKDQVMITCVFGEITLHDGQNNILDWLQNLDKRECEALALLSSNLQTSSRNTSFTRQDGLHRNSEKCFLTNYGKFPEKNLREYLESLTATGDFKIISRPTIFVSNQRKGVISCGQQVATAYSGYGPPPSNITAAMACVYCDEPLSLDVVPTIVSGDEISLEIAPTVGKNHSIVQRKTKITFSNNQVVILGGLFEECKVAPANQSQSEQKSGTKEIIMLICPQIIRNPQTMNDSMDIRYKLSPSNE